MGRMKTAVAAVIVTVMTALLLGLGACGSSDDTSATTAASCAAGKTVKVDPIAQAQTQSAKVGDTILADLPGNPSTGYMWEAMFDDDGVMESGGDASFEPSSDEEGSPGAVTLPLKAAKAGYALTLFKEMPPGEPNGAPANISVVSFNVCAAESGAEPATIEDDMSAQETVELAVGDTLEVELSGNESTGYTWVEDMSYMDDAVLVADGEPVFKADSEDLGSPGKYTLKWKAMAPGDVIVIMKYVAPGEENGVPDDVWVAWVSVKE